MSGLRSGQVQPWTVAVGRPHDPATVASRAATWLSSPTHSRVRHPA